MLALVNPWVTNESTTLSIISLPYDNIWPTNYFKTCTVYSIIQCPSIWTVFSLLIVRMFHQQTAACTVCVQIAFEQIAKASFLLSLRIDEREWERKEKMWAKCVRNQRAEQIRQRRRKSEAKKKKSEVNIGRCFFRSHVRETEPETFGRGETFVRLSVPCKWQV